jgi:hypothetical protein
MNSDLNNKYSEVIVSKILEITSILTLIFFTVYSVIKRFVENEKFYLIPIILFSVNFLFLVEIIIKVKKKNFPCSKNEFRKLVGLAVLNLCYVLFIAAHFLL